MSDTMRQTVIDEFIARAKEREDERREAEMAQPSAGAARVAASRELVTSEEQSTMSNTTPNTTSPHTSTPNHRISASMAARLLGVSRPRVVQLYSAGRLNGRYETDSRVLWINRDEKFEAVQREGAKP